jgi:hypothetical protein
MDVPQEPDLLSRNPGESDESFGRRLSAHHAARAKAIPAFELDAEFYRLDELLAPFGYGSERQEAAKRLYKDADGTYQLRTFRVV